MTCDYPIRQCLSWHIQPKLTHVKPINDGFGIRARCPSCDSHTLTVSAGERDRLTFNCFAGCSQADLRDALTKAGIPAACIPRSRSADKALGQVITAAIQQGTKADRAHTLLRIYLIALGHNRWPKGAELVKLASEAGIPRSTAYKAREAGPLVSTPVPPVPRRKTEGL